jgi:hypothetical protein
MPPTHTNLLRHLLRPARGGAAMLVIVFAFLISIATPSTLVGQLAGLPLVLILLSWFFKYAYILFDHTARGFDEPPVLDISMVNPFSEQRPLAQLAILVVLGSVIAAAYVYVGTVAAAVLTCAVLFFIPASIAILGLESNPFKAMYPVAWLRMMHGLGPLYAFVLEVIAAEAVILGVLHYLRVWAIALTMLDMFAVLSVFSVLGGALYERRHEMGLDTYTSPEQDAERERKLELRKNEKVVTEAYGLMRADAHVKAWDLMQGWVAARGNEPHDLEWLSERVSSWGDPRYLVRMTEEHVARLMVLKKTSEALTVLTKRLDADPSFRPKSAADTLSLAQLAARGGGAPRIARILLSDYATRFPGDPRLSIAEALSQHLA